MKKTRFSLLIFIICYFYSLTTYSWNHSIELGYGYSHDPNHTKYNNSGFLLSGDIIPIRRFSWAFFSITGSLGRFHTTTPVDKNLTSGAASIAVRLYPFRTDPHFYSSYLLASFGPALLSSRRFGYNKQAYNTTIQSNLGFGAEFNHFDINLRLQHFSNAHLGRPNNGMNILYLLSLGYLF